MGKIKPRILAGLALLLAIAVFGEWLAGRMGFGDPPVVILDPEIEYYLKPSSSYLRFGNLVQVNRHGMRSTDFELASHPDELRIMLFGDSVVYGNHHIDQSDTIAAQLQALLEATPDASGSLTGAIAASSWGPENVLKFYQRFGPFPGEAAVVVFSSHDMVDVPFLSTDIIPYRTQPSYGALHDVFLIVAERVSRKLFLQEKEQSYEARQARVEDALTQLLRTLKDDYSSVLLVFHATRQEALAQQASAETYYREKAASEGVEFISLLDTYAQSYEEGVEIHSDAIHLTPEGAAVVSRALFDYCCQEQAEDADRPFQQKAR